MITLELTEDEAKVIRSELWLRLYASDTPQRWAPDGSYRAWLISAFEKVDSALPKPPEFADNH